ncbi:MAG: nucleotidyltransferase family protein [Clostridia bacterium]|nr:nucleotidyltransferase family protein [Clostridia bacterium]
MSDIFTSKSILVKAVASVLNGREAELPDEAVDSEAVYKLAAKNNVGTIVYFADRNKPFLDPAFAERLERSYKASVVREVNQQTQLELIKKDFSENGIEYMLLKGPHLKKLYPVPEMRFMVDMDILVHARDVEKAKELILSYGLEFKMNNGKDLVFIKEPFLTIELHNTLFVEEHESYDYFLGVWDRAEKVDGFEYKMSDNDLYVYTVAHLREHYVSAEACFRPVMDIFLLNKKYGDRLDFDYINTELSKLGLLKFAENIKRLGECMFDGAETDDTMTLMENYVVFGPPVKNAALAAKADKSKPARILSSAFPGLSHMRKLFPVLEKYPFLIVVFWFVRIFKNIFKKETREKLDAIQETGEKEYNVLHDIYRKSGIE